MFFGCAFGCCNQSDNCLGSPSREGFLSFYSLIYFSLFSLPSTNTLVPMPQLQLPLRKEKACKCDQPWRFSRMSFWAFYSSLKTICSDSGRLFSHLCFIQPEDHQWHLTLTSHRQVEKRTPAVSNKGQGWLEEQRRLQPSSSKTAPSSVEVFPLTHT